jgi:hypothetical protein
VVVLEAAVGAEAPAVVSRAAEAGAAAGEALAGQEAALAVVAAVRRGAAGVGSRGVAAAGAVAVAGSKWLHSLRCFSVWVQQLYHYGAPCSAGRGSVSAWRRATASGRGGVTGLGLATQAFLGGYESFVAVFRGEFRTRSAGVHTRVQQAGIMDAV